MPQRPIDAAHTQEGHELRCEWGPSGAHALSPGVDVAVVVDVLSFTTTLSVAAAFTTVRDDLARELAACASGRELADAGYTEDVTIAAELDASDAVPLLADGVFRAT